MNEIADAVEDRTRGIDIVRKSLQATLRQIAENAGDNGAVIAGLLITTEAAVAEIPEDRPAMPMPSGMGF